VAALVVGGGPGSFTGLRIAAATAKAVVRVRGVPLFAFSGLLGAAAARRGDGRAVCALFDARNREVYAGCWRFEAGVQEEMAIEALGLDDLVERFRGDPPLFTGEGAWMHRDALAAAFGADAVAPEEGPSIAAGLLWLADAVPARGRVADRGRWEPDYVRSSGASGSRRRGGCVEEAVRAMPAFRIRLLRESDLPDVMEIETAAFSTPWRENTFRGLMRRADTDLFVADAVGRVVGYAACWTGGRPERAWERGRGRGGARTRDRRGAGGCRGAEGARARGAGALLEVRESNVGAQSVYLERGFSMIGRRRSYYSSPTEDALIMRLRV
jgi:tRNA threonylcarbamoyl adenosine modification protein YeaZ